jgi:hypothetical protein
MTDKCWVCFGGAVECVCDRSRAANDNAPFDPAFIRLPADEKLCQPSSVRRLAVSYVAMGFSRRSVLNYVSSQLFEFEGVAVTAGGRRFNTSDIDVDEVFRTDDDPSERWMSNFLGFATRPPTRGAQTRLIDRYRVLWLALAISHREQAELAVK